ncbi:MAG: hypothetical protein M3014_15055, partial [Chloroflexota bacterium]|nr:hypothetical protein [Chloroflexota bacterium]
ADSQIGLRWSTDNGQLVPVGRKYLWNGPMGALLGRSYAGGAVDMAWFTASQLPTAGTAIRMERRDGFLGWQQINSALVTDPSIPIAWQGKLHVLTTGDYTFDAPTSGQISILIDEHLIGATNVTGAATQLPAAVKLTEGEHGFAVRFKAGVGSSQLQLYWQPPNSPRSIIPPTAFTPAEGGALPASERPNVPSPDASVIGATNDQKVRVVGSFPAATPWKEARGLAVLPDGRIVVGDTGSHQLIFYSKEGRQIATAGNEQSFKVLSDVATDKAGNIACLDAENGDVRIFNSSGQQTSRIPHTLLNLAHSSGITYGPDGKIYIADTARGRVLRVAADGSRVEAEMHGGGEGMEPLDQPLDVAVTTDNNVYVVDLRGRVVHLNAQGGADKEWMLPVGSTRGGSHMAVWGRQLAVTNPDTGRVSTIDPNQGVVRGLRDTGTASLQLTMPIGIAAGPDGRLYVLDSQGERIEILEADK